MNIKQVAVLAIPVIAASAVAFAGAAPISRAGGSSSLVHREGVRKAAVTTTLYGGGATLPALAYLGSFSTNPQVTDAVGSAFYYYGHSIVSGESISYCQTGSGFGKKVLDGVNVPPTPPPTTSSSNDANLPCAAIGVAPVVGTNGFGASGQNVADFSGSDSPLASTEYSSFVTDGAVGAANPIAGRIEPVQLPVVSGAVAIYYNNKDTAVTSLGHVPMTDEAICKVASGQIYNWLALYNELVAEKQPVGSTPFASKPLYFVSRYDGSGTSFSFTNHLAAVCGSYTSDFGVNQTFSAIITANPPNANFVAGSGNPGVTACVATGSSSDCLVYASASPGTTTAIPNGGDGALGYVEAANTGKPKSPLAYATVNGENPFTNLPAAAASLSASSLVTDMTVNFSTSGPATLSALAPPDKKGCVVLMPPSAYAVPKAGYPIIAVSNLEFSEKINLSKSAYEQKLASMFYNASNFASGKITSIDSYKATTGKTGFANLPILATNAVITNALGCIESP